MMAKPRLVRKCGVWSISGPINVDPEYWPLYEAAIAWSVQRWKDENL